VLINHTIVISLRKQTILHSAPDISSYIGNSQLLGLLETECQITSASPHHTRSSSADEIANVNFLSCAQKQLCVGMQVYQIQ